MYRLNTHSIPVFITASKENDCYVWNQRILLLNFEDLNKLSETVGVKLDSKKKVICISCLERKQTRNQFSCESSRTQRKLEFIHSDVCGPMEVPTLRETRYFITFIEEFTRKVFIYLLKKKSDVF